MGAPKGNKYAVRAKEWTEAIRRAIREEYGSDWQEAIKEAAKPLVKAARAGDLVALKEIGDRIEGKSLQTSELTVTRINSLEDIPTHELERIALGSGQDTSEAASGEQGHNSVH